MNTKIKSISRELLFYNDKLTPDVAKLIAQYLDEPLNSHLLKELKVWCDIANPVNYMQKLIDNGSMCWICHLSIKKDYVIDKIRDKKRHIDCSVKSEMKNRQKTTDKLTDKGELVWLGVQAFGEIAELFGQFDFVKQYVDLDGFGRHLQKSKNDFIAPCNETADRLVKSNYL